MRGAIQVASHREASRQLVKTWKDSEAKRRTPSLHLFPLRVNMSTAPPSMAFLAAVSVLIGVALSAAGAAAYTNHTVGGEAGWLFNASTNTTSANYSDWAAKQTFGLGDYLVFITNTNQTVVHTYNATTYANCTADFAEDDDTTLYSSGSSDFGHPMTVEVPLTIEGSNYFFSDAGDGFDCEHGMSFEIKVVHGSGLPASLNHPPPPPYTPGPAYESPPVFLGGGGGQGQELNGCGLQISGGGFAIAAVAVVVGIVALWTED